MQPCTDSVGHMRSELGEAFLNWRPACALQIRQASVDTSVCVCELWGLEDPTSPNHVILESHLKRQRLKNTAFLRCKMEINVPPLYSKPVFLFKCLYFLLFVILSQTPWLDHQIPPSPKSSQPRVPGMVPPTLLLLLIPTHLGLPPTFFSPTRVNISPGAGVTKSP